MYFRRLQVLVALLAAAFLVLFGRLMYLQIIRGDYYSGRSEEHRISEKPVDAFRGSIYDRDGELLAVDQHSFDISVPYRYLVPQTETARRKPVAQWAEWAPKLAAITKTSFADLSATRAEIVVRVSRRSDLAWARYKGRGLRRKDFKTQEEFQAHPLLHDVPFEQVALLEARHREFPNVLIECRPIRLYPNGALAANVIGYMSLVTDSELERSKDDPQAITSKRYLRRDTVGRAGIEREHEDQLRGARGKQMQEISTAARRIEKLIVEIPPEPGLNVHLTLSKRIQAAAEVALGDAVGAAVVMDPNNGDILALATSPRFNPNTFREDYEALSADSRSPLLNRPVRGTLPPGSVFKLVVALAALTEGRIDPHTAFDCSGHITLGSHTFRCSAKYGHGTVALEEAIEHSCNVYFYETGRRLGGATLSEWARKFGFGECTNLGLGREEVRGRVPTPRSVPEVLNVSIGQGALTVTTVQVAQMVSAIANGGRLVQPRLVSHFTNEDGQIVRESPKPRESRLPVSSSAIESVRRGMVKVPLSGTAKEAGLEPFLVAGKTGTAETGREDENHAWFAGYAPHNAPRYAFVFVLERVKGHGGEVAAPLARRMFELIQPSENRVPRNAVASAAQTTRPQGD